MFKSKLWLFIVPIFFMSGFAFSAASNMTQQAVATTQYVGDASITAKVKSDLLLDKDIKSLAISVTTSNGVVTLSGDVENEMQKNEAVKITSHVSGVKSVKDDLTIKAK